MDYGGLVPHGNPAAAPHACTSLWRLAGPGKRTGAGVRQWCIFRVRAIFLRAVAAEAGLKGSG